MFKSITLAILFLLKLVSTKHVFVNLRILCYLATIQAIVGSQQTIQKKSSQCGKVETL